MESVDSIRWQAVATRDSAYDNLFIYAVKTTGIFCRPICKARLARRSNVEFFDNAADATAAGYRACKRCQPQLTGFNPEADKIRLACEYLHSLPPGSPLPRLDVLARKAGLTKHYFHRLFKREVGMTPREYGQAIQRGGGATSETSEATTPSSGATSQQYFDRLARETPRTEPGEALEPCVVYALRETIFGPLLMVFVDYNVAKVELCSSWQEANAVLESTYAGMRCFDLGGGQTDQDCAALQMEVEAVVEALERPSGKMLEMPMFSRGRT